MSVSLNDTSQAIVVVPTFAPMRMPRLALKEMTPASTSVTARAVTALLDCTNAVAAPPAKNPFQQLAVTRPSDAFRVSPPATCSSWLKLWSENRNRTTAATAEKKTCNLQRRHPDPFTGFRHSDRW